MGTSELASSVLDALISTQNDQIVGIYTKPTKPSGRGMKVHETTIDKLGQANSIPIYKVKVFQQDDISHLRHLNPDIIVVVSYGIILSKEVLSIPKYGCINLHPSSLPRWRGASPLQRALMAGDTTTSVCIIKMGEGLDDGDIILHKHMEIPPNINHTTLLNQVSTIGGTLMLKALDHIRENKVNAIKQSTQGITYAHKIQNSERKIDWQDSAHIIHCKIRALSEKPGAYFIHQHNGNDIIIKILSSTLIDYEVIKDAVHTCKNIKPGDFFSCSIGENKYNAILCGNHGAIVPQIVQKAGSRPCHFSDMLNGMRVPIQHIQ